MPSITLVPIGGLCNRLRAIQSAIALANDCHVSLRVVWLRDQGLGARFKDLFQPHAFITDSTSWLRYGVARRRNGYLPAIWQRALFDTCIDEADLSSVLDSDTSEAGKAQVIRQRIKCKTFIQTGLGFYPCDDRLFKHQFIPSASVRQLLDQRLSLITPHTVGIHIRRTDNTRAIHHSPLSAFEQAMQADLERDPDTTFYVATDDPAVLLRLKSHFPSSIITHSLSTTLAPTRSTVAGMQDAVAELFTLIACPRFHGSYWSSFSDTVVACHDKGMANIIC